LYKLFTSAVVGCLVTLLFTGCGGSSSNSMDATDPNAPITGTVSGTGNPQVASFSVTLPKAGNVSVEFGPDTSYAFSTSQQHTPATGSLRVTLFVAGMQANTTYHMRAKVEYDDGGLTAGTDQTFTSGAVPPVIPSFTVAATPGMTPQPGVELVNPVGPQFNAPFATDLKGNVIWTYTPREIQLAGESIYPIKLLPNGHLMCILGTNSSTVVSSPPPAGTVHNIREFDLTGNTVRELSIEDLNTKLAAANYNLKLEIFSHDFTLLPNGHVLVIANTTKQFTDLPGYPGTTTVIGDVVIDLDQDFNPVWLWNEFDHLDVNRHPMNFPDWTHSNAIAYSPDDGNFLISIRHQHWIVKVDYRNGAGTGNVLWRLGNGGDFILQNGTNPDDWFYAQHDVNFVSSNTTGSFQLAIMDNGNNRALSSGLTCGSANAPACYTTIPVMQVDENAKTASFLFHQKLPGDLYSFFAGDTRVQPNTNVEYDLAGVGVGTSYVFEVTPTAAPQTVWEMHLANSNTYRAYRMPSLYPGVQW
jgi:arylsulfate sulfotransferase